MTNRWGLALLIGSVLSGACHRSAPVRVPLPCEGGACQQPMPCELGACQDDLGLTVSRYSPNEGTFAADVDTQCPVSPAEVPQLATSYDDSQIPEVDRARTRASNMKTGSNRLQDHELHQHLLGVQSALFDCLDLAACYDDEQAGTGELDFSFELEPDGRVSAVTVTPSEELDHPFIRSCARRSLFEYRFPSWNGARMTVSYQVAIAETY